LIKTSERGTKRKGTSAEQKGRNIKDVNAADGGRSIHDEIAGREKGGALSSGRNRKVFLISPGDDPGEKEKQRGNRSMMGRKKKEKYYAFYSTFKRMLL